MIPAVIVWLVPPAHAAYKYTHCHWGYHFTGALVYADDIVLLALSASAFHVLLKTCEPLREFVIVGHTVRAVECIPEFRP